MNHCDVIGTHLDPNTVAKLVVLNDLNDPPNPFDELDQMLCFDWWANEYREAKEAYEYDFRGDPYYPEELDRRHLQ